MFGTALSSLKSLVQNRGGDHADILHEAIRQAEANPQQLADVVSKLSRHPELGEEVRTWMVSPQGQSVMNAVGGDTQARPSEQDSIAQANATAGSEPQSAADQMNGQLRGSEPEPTTTSDDKAPVLETANPDNERT